MKDRSDIKTILGLTQIEMGMLLGVPRSVWSMFKSGQRDIQLGAKEQLAHYMDASFKRKKHCKEIEAINQEEIKNVKLVLKQDLINIELKIKRITKEISNLARIREQLFAALETAVLLAAENKHPKAELLSNYIKTRVDSSIKKHNLASLYTLQLKKENLEMLKNSLEQKIKEK